jgi:platelet-activating factor acetylhydrolase IB subunit alpha
MSLKLWDTANEYKNVKTMHGHDHTVSSVKFTPSGDHVVSASRDKTIRLWEVATGWVYRWLRVLRQRG